MVFGDGVDNHYSIMYCIVSRMDVAGGIALLRGEIITLCPYY